MAAATLTVCMCLQLCRLPVTVWFTGVVSFGMVLGRARTHVTHGVHAQHAHAHSCNAWTVKPGCSRVPGEHRLLPRGLTDTVARLWSMQRRPHKVLRQPAEPSGNRKRASRGERRVASTPENGPVAETCPRLSTGLGRCRQTRKAPTPHKLLLLFQRHHPGQRCSHIIIPHVTTHTPTPILPDRLYRTATAPAVPVPDDSWCCKLGCGWGLGLGLGLGLGPRTGEQAWVVRERG